MIENEREYKVTLSCLEAFKKVLKDFDDDAVKESGIHPRLIQAQKEALQSQIDELQEQVDQYKPKP